MKFWIRTLALAFAVIWGTSSYYGACLDPEAERVSYVMAGIQAGIMLMNEVE